MHLCTHNERSYLMNRWLYFMERASWIRLIPFEWMKLWRTWSCISLVRLNTVSSLTLQVQTHFTICSNTSLLYQPVDQSQSTTCSCTVITCSWVWCLSVRFSAVSSWFWWSVGCAGFITGSIQNQTAFSNRKRCMAACDESIWTSYIQRSR